MDFLPVRAYDNYITANLELSLLKHAGINCHLKDEYTITIDPLLSPALGGMKLMVEGKSFHRAKSILDDADESFLKSIPCPNCKEASLKLITEVTRYDTLAGRLKSLIINGQEQKVKTYYKCGNCLSEFTELPDEREYEG